MSLSVPLNFDGDDVKVLDSVRRLIVVTYDLVDKYPVLAENIKDLLGACYVHGTREVLGTSKKLKANRNIQARILNAIEYLESMNLDSINYSVFLITVGYFLNYDEKEAYARVKPYLVDMNDLKERHYMMLGSVVEMFSQMAANISYDAKDTPRVRDINANKLYNRVLALYRDKLLNTMAPFRKNDFTEIGKKFHIPFNSIATTILQSANKDTVFDDSNSPAIGTSMLSVDDDFYSFLKPKNTSTPASNVPVSQVSQTVTFRDTGSTMVGGAKKKDKLVRLEAEKRKTLAAQAQEEWEIKQQKEIERKKREEEDLAEQDTVLLEDLNLIDIAQNRNRTNINRWNTLFSLEQPQSDAQSYFASVGGEGQAAFESMREKKKVEASNLSTKEIDEIEEIELEEALKQSRLEQQNNLRLLENKIKELEQKQSEELMREKIINYNLSLEQKAERRKSEKLRLLEFQKAEDERKRQKELDLEKDRKTREQQIENDRLKKEVEKMRALRRGEYGLFDEPARPTRVSDPYVTPLRRTSSFSEARDESQTRFGYDVTTDARRDPSPDFGPYRHDDGSRPYAHSQDIFRTDNLPREDRSRHDRPRVDRARDDRIDLNRFDPVFDLETFPPHGDFENRIDFNNRRIRNTFRKIENTDYPSSVRTPHVDYFDFDIQGQTMTEILGNRFFRYRFHDEVEREFTKKTILERILLDNDSGVLAKQIALRGISDFNATELHQRGVDIAAVVSRQCIADAATPRASNSMLPTPKLGTTRSLNSSILKSINTSLNNEKFYPEKEGGKPINYFLAQVGNAISMYRLNEQCSFELLKYVLKVKSPLYNVIEEEQEKGSSFLQIWDYVQTSMAPSYNGEKVEAQIKKLLSTKPSGSLGPHLIAIHDLAIQKYANITKRTEKEAQVFFTTKEMIFQVLRKFYPLMIQPVVDAMRKIDKLDETKKGVYRDQNGPPSNSTDRIRTLIQVISNMERDYAIITGDNPSLCVSINVVEPVEEASVNSTNVSPGSTPLTVENLAQALPQALAMIGATDTRQLKPNRPPKSVGFTNNSTSSNNSSNNNPNNNRIDKQLGYLADLCQTVAHGQQNLQNQINQNATASAAPVITPTYFAPTAVPLVHTVPQTMAPSNTYTHLTAQAQPAEAQAYAPQNIPQNNMVNGFAQAGNNNNNNNNNYQGGFRNNNNNRNPGYNGNNNNNNNNNNNRGGSNGYRGPRNNNNNNNNGNLNNNNVDVNGFRNRNNGNGNPNGYRAPNQGNNNNNQRQFGNNNNNNGNNNGNRPFNNGFVNNNNNNRPPYNNNQNRPNNQYNGNRNNNNNNNNNGFNNGPRLVRSNDPNMVCLLCGFTASHEWQNCRKYPGTQPTGTACTNCSGQHPGPCKFFRNNNNNGNVPNYQNNNNNRTPAPAQAQPARGNGGILGNNGQQAVPQHAQMHATTADQTYVQQYTQPFVQNI